MTAEMTDTKPNTLPQSAIELHTLSLHFLLKRGVLERRKKIYYLSDLGIQFGSVFSVNIVTAGASVVFRRRHLDGERQGLGNKVL